MPSSWCQIANADVSCSVIEAATLRNPIQCAVNGEIQKKFGHFIIKVILRQSRSQLAFALLACLFYV